MSWIKLLHYCYRGITALTLPIPTVLPHESYPLLR